MNIRVVSLHAVVPTVDEFNTARDILYGDELVGEPLEGANRDIRKHFAGLYLIEIEVNPPNSHVDWNAITQPIVGVPSTNWQVPWDERSMGNGRWAFFMHFVQLNQPLQTSIGPIQLPVPTPIPHHLAIVKYDLPF